MFDREIDRTIDDVARGMTAGEPAHDLRARVLERIDARHHDEGRQWHRRMISVAAVALIVVVAAVMGVMLLRDQKNVDQARGPESAAPQRQTAAPQQRLAAPEQQTAAPRQQPPSRQRQTRAPQPGAVAALAPPPLDVESIALGALAPPPPLEIEQLEPIAPIAITPLGEGDRP